MSKAKKTGRLKPMFENIQGKGGRYTSDTMTYAQALEIFEANGPDVFLELPEGIGKSEEEINAEIEKRVLAKNKKIEEARIKKAVGAKTSE